MKPVREKIGSGRDVTEREKASLTMFCNYKPNQCVVAHPFKSQEIKTVKKNQERCKKEIVTKSVFCVIVILLNTFQFFRLT